MTTLTTTAAPARPHPYVEAVGSLVTGGAAGVVMDVTDGVSRTWAQIAETASRLAGHLHRSGVGLGDRVVVRQLNSIGYLEAVLGVCWAGAAFVPTLGTLSPAEQEAVDETVEPALIIDPRQPLPMAAPIPPVSGSDDSLSCVLFTSGSSGRPKGVAQSYASTAAAMRGWSNLVGAVSDAVILVCTPVSHAAGRLVEAAMQRGASVVLLRTARADAVLSAVAAHGVTDMVLVPTVLQELVDSPSLVGADLSSLRHVVYAAAPTSPSLVQRAQERLGEVMCTVYGSTEIPAPITLLDIEDHRVALAGKPELLRSCGRLFLEDTELAIVDERLRPVAAGDEGQLVVRTNAVTVGYWRAAEEWSRRTRDGWFLTGDIGHLDSDGYLYLADRRDDLIITGGHNVYPTEVENVLSSHSRVREAAVVGEAHPRWGEAVVAVVSVNAPVDPDELLLLCRSILSPHKVPKRVVIVDELPKTGHAKVSRRMVRDVVLGESTAIHGAQ